MRGFMVLLFTLWMTAAHGATIAPSGIAFAVDPDAYAETNAQPRLLTVGDDIFIGDKVVTDELGLVQIRFADETELVVGPRSSLVIEDYLLRSDGTLGKFAVNALAGTFRFVTGNGRKEDYVINTPGGTIGVRGTAFDFTIENETTDVLLYGGLAILCADGQQCATLDEGCETGQFNPAQSQVAGLSENATGVAREALQAKFEYAQSQTALNRAFWVEELRNCKLAGPAGLAPKTQAEVMDVCTPVIGEQYAGDQGRAGYCIGAVIAFLDLVEPTPERVADLAIALAELYQDDRCRLEKTELPEALTIAADYSGDKGQRASIIEVSYTVQDCAVVLTAALPLRASPS